MVAVGMSTFSGENRGRLLVEWLKYAVCGDLKIIKGNEFYPFPFS